MTTIQDIAKAITDAQRDNGGLSTPELATRAGVSKAGLYRFLSGEDVRLSTALAVLDALGRDVVTVPRSVSHVLHSSGQVNMVASAYVTAPPSARRVHTKTAVSSRLARLQDAIAASRKSKK